MIKRTMLLAAIVVVLVGLIAYSQWRPQPLKVSGFIEADEIRLGSRVGGRVAAVHVDEGQQVRKGDLLIELEPFDLLAREKEAQANLLARQAEYDRLKAGYRAEEIAQAKAQVDQLQANLEQLINGPRPQEIDSARAQLEVAKAEVQLAQQNYERTLRVFNMGATTREEMDRITERLQAARQMVLVRQNELDLLVAGTRAEEVAAARARLEQAAQAHALAKEGFRPEEVAQAAAARDAAQAALDAIEQQKAELSITSPVDGVVESLDLQPGDLAPAGAPVMSIIDLDRLWVRAYVPQNVVALQVGQQLPVEVDGVENGPLTGTVEFISRQAEFTPSNVQTPDERAKQVFRIKVVLQGAIPQVRPGMAADVWLEPKGASE